MKEKQSHVADSSFNWLIGSWAVEATGYAKLGFRNKTQFNWTEPQREIFKDGRNNFYMTFNDSLTP